MDNKAASNIPPKCVARGGMNFQSDPSAKQAEVIDAVCG